MPDDGGKNSRQTEATKEEVGEGSGNDYEEKRGKYQTDAAV